MRRILSILLCIVFILTLMPVGRVHAENSYTYDGLTITGDITAADLTDTGYSIRLNRRQDGGYHHVTLTGTSTEGHYFTVGNNANAYITLDGLNLSGDSVAFSVNSGAVVVIYLKGSNSLIGNGNCGLSVGYDSIVNIEQVPAGAGENPEDIKGFLYAAGSGNYPGIKAARQDWVDGTYSYPTLNIRSGTVTAIGGRQAAGIGGGNGETGGKINIYGGVVTAIGNRGAGIGGGNYSENGGQIFISGGIVNATSPEAGAGIGGGDDGSDGGNIYIAGGLVTAVGAGAAAGIGGGNNGTSGDITITGGTVVAKGREGGAGIGGGLHNNNDGGNVDSIRLYGGTIFAGGSDGGEDIGKGAGGTDSGSIYIADFPAVSTGIPTAVFLRNDTTIAPTHIDTAFSHVGSYSYEGISKYGFELSVIYPDSPPPITATLPEGVTGLGDNWLEDFWTDQLNIWEGSVNAGAYLQPRSVYYHDPEDISGEIIQTQHKGTAGKILGCSIFTRLGYGFTTWMTTPGGGSEYSPGVDYIFNNDLDLYANWEVNLYLIHYDLDGGTTTPLNPGDYTVNSDSITLNNPTKLGYTFVGWTGTGISGTSMNVTIPTGSTGTRSYTANWTPNNYDVHYDANGGEGSMQDTIFTYDVQSNLPANGFTRKGYSFAGWAMAPGDDAAYTDEQSVKNFVEEGEITLYAKWIMDNYTITYDLNGGTTMTDNPENYTVESNNITLNNPIKIGYTFTGWLGTGITGTSIDVTIPTGSEGNREYIADWTINSYPIIYDLDGGIATPLNPRDYTINSDSITLNNPTKLGYTFVGWTGTGISGTSMNVIIPPSSTGTRSYRANWTMDSYTITYDLDGGTIGFSNPENYTVESTEIILTNPDKEGYIFIGWSGTGIEGKSTGVAIPLGSTGNRSYKANWTVTPSGYLQRTLTDITTGISVSGMIHEDAVLTVSELFFSSDSGCDAIRQRINDNDFVLLLGKDITLSQDFIGSLTITIPVGSDYNGKSITVMHCVKGKSEDYIVTVREGKAIFDVTDLSPFAVFVAKDEKPENDGRENIPQTGDTSHPLLWLMLAVLTVAITIVLLIWAKRRKT
ncbi:MAG: InlB B-repeat-containing protein [Eubacteriales bacterium]